MSRREWASYGLVLATGLVTSLVLYLHLSSQDGGTLVVETEGGLMDQTLVEVEQGPMWLAQFLYDPPGWAFTAVLAAAGLVVVLAGIGYVRGGGIDDEVKAEAIKNLTVVGCIAASTWALMSLAPLPYAGDVLGGSAIGFLVALKLQELIFSELDLPDPAAGDDGDSIPGRP